MRRRWHFVVLILLVPFLSACQEEGHWFVGWESDPGFRVYASGTEGSLWWSPYEQDGLLDVHWQLNEFAYPFYVEIRLGTHAEPREDDLVLLSRYCQQPGEGCYRNDEQAYHLDLENQLWRLDSRGRFEYLANLTLALQNQSHFRMHLMADDGYLRISEQRSVTIY